MQSDRPDFKLTRILYFFVIILAIQKTFTVTYTEKKLVNIIQEIEAISLKFETKTYFDKAHALYGKLFLFGMCVSNFSALFMMGGGFMIFGERKLFFKPSMLVESN